MTDFNIRIRNAELKDMQDVHEMIRELAEFEQAAQEHVLSLDQMKVDFSQDKFHVLIAEALDKTIVGMAFYYYAYSTWKGKYVFLEDLLVKEAFRKRGIGSQLLDKLTQLCKDEGIPRLKWEVLDWNQPAIDLYEKIGAERSKEWLIYRLNP